jgi:replicative DNA helicase Mcm
MKDRATSVCTVEVIENALQRRCRAAKLSDDPSKNKKKPLESVEIIETGSGGTLNLALKGKRNSSWFTFTLRDTAADGEPKKKKDRLDIHYVEEQIEVACKESNLDPVSKENVHRCAYDALLEYYKDNKAMIKRLFHENEGWLVVNASVAKELQRDEQKWEQQNQEKTTTESDDDDNDTATTAAALVPMEEEDDDDYEDDNRGRTKKLLSVAEALRAEQSISSLMAPPFDYQVHGMIGSISPVFRMIITEKMVCPRCGYVVEKNHEIPVAEPTINPLLAAFMQCPNCMKHGLRMSDCVFIPTIFVELMDTDSFADIERLTTFFYGDDTRGVNAGERVTADGLLHITQNRRKGRFFTVFHAKAVDYESREKLELSPSDIDAIKRFAKMPRGLKAFVQGRSYKNVKEIENEKQDDDLIIRALVKMHTPEVIGHDVAKEAALMVEAGSGPDVGNKYRERNRIHSILVGPPGISKTMILKSSVRHVPNSRFESGQHATGKSLTAIIAREDEMYHLRLGPVALCREAVLAINEVGRISEEDQVQLLDAWEEGQFSINKHGFNAKIRADAAGIMSANPRDTAWKTESPDSKINLDDIPMLKVMLDRIDLVITMKGLTEEREIRKYAERKAEMHGRPVVNYDSFLRKYIQRAKSINPVVSDQAKSILTEAYVSIAKGGHGSPRVLDSLFRLTKVRARLKLKEIADAKDARESVSFYNSTTQQFREGIVVPEDPHELAYQKMVEILSQSKLPILLVDLAERASQHSQQLQSYLKGARNIGANWKLRRVYQSLVNHSSIKQVQDKPIALQWIEGQKLESFSSASDVSDVCEGVGEGNETNFSQKIIEKGQDAASHTSHTSDRAELPSRNTGGQPKVSPPAIVPCSFCSYKFESVDRDEAIKQVVRHGFRSHKGRAVVAKLAEMGFDYKG